MEALLISIYVIFTVMMAYLCGQATLESRFLPLITKRPRFVAVAVGMLVWFLLVKYGWPIYKVAVVKVFA